MLECPHDGREKGPGLGGLHPDHFTLQRDCYPLSFNRYLLYQLMLEREINKLS